MPIKIIRQDITKIECDAIVNPTNKHMMPSGGTDAAIHEAAGPELLEYCRRFGGVSVGEAKITPAFNLPSKYIIHTAGPQWEGGLAGERVLLRSCYEECMKLAIEHGCASVAFPLIASGMHGYPKDRVLREATDVIGKVLDDCEMDVYIVVYDKTAYSISREIYDDVQTFIDNFYVETCYFSRDDRAGRRKAPLMRAKNVSIQSARDDERMETDCCMSSYSSSLQLFRSRKLDDMLKDMDKGFRDTLFHYIDKCGISDVEAYKRSNVNKKTFSKIKCNDEYRPSKETAVSFAIGLHLNFDETKHLLSTAGMCLSRSNKFDVIIEYFIVTGNYETIFDVNEVLYQFDLPLLGV